MSLLPPPLSRHFSLKTSRLLVLLTPHNHHRHRTRLTHPSTRTFITTMSTSTIPRHEDLPLHATPSTCEGRTFIVTGANTGLGYEATRHLLSAGASKVIMAVRSLESGTAAKTRLLDESLREHQRGASASSEVWPLDLADYTSVKAFARRANAELERLDGVLLNGGAFDFERVEVEGHVSAVTVNVLSQFLLALLLVPKLRETAALRSSGESNAPHVTFVGSSYGFSKDKAWGAIREDPIVGMDAEWDNIAGLYPLSKLFVVMLARQLGTAAPLSTTGGVVFNVVAPGLCRTGLARGAPWWFQAVIGARAWWYGKSAEQGSRVLLHGLFAGEESHGRYLESCRVAEDRLPTWMVDDEGRRAQKRAWDVVVAELEAIEPGCVDRLVGSRNL